MTEPLQARTSALIVAAGSGLRLGDRPKALLELEGKTLVEHVAQSVRAFSSQVIVGVRSEDVARVQPLLGDQVTVLSGGATRQKTVERLLAVADRDIVLIHDVARPFASRTLYQSVLQAALQFGGAAPVLQASTSDSVALVDGDWLGDTLPRDRVVCIQTPYAFTRRSLQRAIRLAKEEGWEETSVTTLLTRAGYKVRLVEGDLMNTKITYPKDVDDAKERFVSIT